MELFVSNKFVMMEIPITQARKSLFFMSSFGSDTPFMLLAKLKVKEDKVAEYLEIADKTDKAVEADEPGMLHHTFHHFYKLLMILFVSYGQKFIKMMMLY